MSQECPGDEHPERRMHNYRRIERHEAQEAMRIAVEKYVEHGVWSLRARVAVTQDPDLLVRAQAKALQAIGKR